MGETLVDPSGGRATAAAIPGARLELIEGMGHSLPRPLREPIADLIVDTVVEGERRRTGARSLPGSSRKTAGDRPSSDRGSPGEPRHD
jgi:hypothetical protein